MTAEAEIGCQHWRVVYNPDAGPAVNNSGHVMVEVCFDCGARVENWPDRPCVQVTEHKPISWPAKLAELKKEREGHSVKVTALTSEIAKLRRETMDAAGWTGCCRCYPRMVSDDGFCGCCLFNHATGVKIAQPRSFFELQEEEESE